MYRREYPDVPGLFDARFSQYNQPSLSKEFQKTWLISLIGLVMVLVGCGLLMWNEGRAVRTSVALEGRIENKLSGCLLLLGIFLRGAKRCTNS